MQLPEKRFSGQATESRLRRDLSEGHDYIEIPFAWIRANDAFFAGKDGKQPTNFGYLEGLAKHYNLILYNEYPNVAFQVIHVA